ncbi:hypothetical protein [Phyllobacterium phragmitis]|uniref:hypothetical protein n=1 Tax=Phyllobacterium phragmitis TaxID=2670329 RepID=UPI0038B39854
MIAYTMVGTNDLERSLAFYEPIMEAIGLDQCWKDHPQHPGAGKTTRPFHLFFTWLFDERAKATEALGQVEGRAIR